MHNLLIIKPKKFIISIRLCSNNDLQFLLFLVLQWHETNRDLVNFIPLELTPLISYIIVLIYLFCPLKNTFNYFGRLYLGRLFVETMSSITTTSDLRHTWLGDQMTSLVGPFRVIMFIIIILLKKKKDYVQVEGLLLF